MTDFDPNRPHDNPWTERRSQWRPRDEDARRPGEVDYARIIHSASFRRLQGKTQILTLGDGDFYRNRLTHSLEVAQIAGGLVAHIRAHDPGHQVIAHLPEHAMIQAIASAHDIGHPPFGHGGEVALHYIMRDHGGFEGNGQTLRVLTRLEHFSRDHGADLTRRTLLGVLKYPAPLSRLSHPRLIPCLQSGTTVLRLLDAGASKPAKGYLDTESAVVDWILAPLGRERDAFCAITPPKETPKPAHGKTKHKSLDCSIMDLADDIAYGVHDLEDALAMKMVSYQHLAALEPLFIPFLDQMRGADKRFEPVLNDLLDSAKNRKKRIGQLVGFFIQSARLIEEDFETPLLRYRLGLSEPAQALLDGLKGVVLDHMIRAPAVQQLEFKGQAMVLAVAEAFTADPDRLLPADVREAMDRIGPRAICDYIAGMTDSYLVKTYERLFAPRMGSVFDRL